MLNRFLSSEIYLFNLEKSYVTVNTYQVAVSRHCFVQEETFHIDWSGFLLNIYFIFL